jgi:hypothetical protein
LMHERCHVVDELHQAATAPATWRLSETIKPATRLGNAFHRQPLTFRAVCATA